MMSYTSDYLEILGVLAPAASSAAYTRMTTPLSLPARYVEFLTTSINAPTPPLPPHLTSLYVAANTPLYFSDYPAPAGPLNLGQLGAVKFGGLGNPQQVTPTGLELYDGSPMTVQKVNGTGPICGLNGTAKDGTVYNLAITATNAQVASRGPNAQVTWVFCKAELSVGGQSQFSMSMGLCPEDLLATFSLHHGNINSAIGLDLSPAVGTGGYAKATRTITYYGETVSNVTVNMQDVPDVPVRIATSPLHQFTNMVDLMPVPLATVLGEEAGQTQTSPVMSLGSLDVQSGETETSYVNRGTALAGPAFARLGLVLSQSSIQGFDDLAQWLGWSMSSVGKTYLQAALMKSYTDLMAWRAKQGPAGNKSAPLRSMLGTDVGSQVVDKVFDLAWQH
jgi:hypothetical protein